MKELQKQNLLFVEFKREDKIEVGKCLVPNAIDEYLQFDKDKFPVKYLKGETKYWDRDEYEKSPESQLKRLGELYLQLIERGLDTIEVGKNLYELGIVKELPGFVQDPSEKEIEEIRGIDIRRIFRRMRHLLL